MSAPPPPPPPRHHARLKETKSTTASSSTVAKIDGEKKTWRDSFKSKGSTWGKKGFEKSITWSDSIGGKVNTVAEKLGSERFWPVTGDFPQEMDKAARILRAFTVDGVATTEEVQTDDGKGKKEKKSLKVLRKIPPQIIQEARGLAIFTSMRTGIAPFGGAGGTGVVVAKLPDGSWSAPAGFMPQNMSTGLMFGVDVYDCVLVIRTQEALEGFFTHKATLGTDIAVVAGPLGAGAAMETGMERTPAFSYVRSRGFYAGVQLVGQIFVDRIDENAAVYHWPGIKSGDILQGRVRHMPHEYGNLLEALKDAESGKAQSMKGDGLDVVVMEGVNDLVLEEGEVLKLPPTPTQVSDDEGDGDPEATRIHYEKGSPQASLASVYSAAPSPEASLQHLNSQSQSQTQSHPPPLPFRGDAAPPPLPSRAKRPVPPTPGHAAPAPASASSTLSSPPPPFPVTEADSESLRMSQSGNEAIVNPGIGLEAMTDSEAREWEEFLQNEKLHAEEVLERSQEQPARVSGENAHEESDERKVGRVDDLLQLEKVALDDERKESENVNQVDHLEDENIVGEQILKSAKVEEGEAEAEFHDIEDNEFESKVHGKSDLL